MKITRFEELICWQKARELSNRVYGFINADSSFKKDLRLSGQIVGAAISIMNNISEGFDAGSNNEFVRFLYYSRRSSSETQNCLYIALDQKYISKSEFEESYKRCEEVRKLIDGLIKHLKNN
jgi:four helix bundle protein